MLPNDSKLEARAPEWPQRMKTDLSARYLQDVHGIPVAPKTLRNRRAAGTGPACRYFGTTPLYDRDVLDRWATTEALTKESPVTRTRRLAKAAGDAAYRGEEDIDRSNRAI
jgi:hypothetical protein